MSIKKIKQLFRSLFLLLFLVAFFPWTGCEKDKIYKTDVRNVSGLILFYGEPAVDGCGWIIKIDDNDYSPVNLNDAFKTDSLEVVLDFNYLESYWRCGFREPGYQKVEVLKIDTIN